MTLTPKQKKVLDAIKFLQGKGESPTVREIGQLVGLRSSATVQKHLQSLEEAGVIERRSRLSRSIRVTEGALGDGTGSDVSGATSRGRSRIPLVGRIAAGQPLEIVDRAVDVSSDGTESLAGEFDAPGVFSRIAIDPSVFFSGAQPGELVALRVSGESMIESGILDGDVVIIRPQETVEEGDVAAVVVDGAGTLKRWSRGAVSKGESESNPVRLHPANERFPVLEIREEDGKDVRVFGKYVGLVRGEHL